MNETLLRIREIFKESGKSQTEIGKRLSKTSQYVWKLLNDDNANPSDSVIKDISREFGISEEWIRTGKGNKNKNTNIEFGEICREIGVSDEKAKQAIMDYWKLSEDDKELFWQFAERFLK